MCRGDTSPGLSNYNATQFCDTRLTVNYEVARAIYNLNRNVDVITRIPRAFSYIVAFSLTVMWIIFELGYTDIICIRDSRDTSYKVWNKWHIISRNISSDVADPRRELNYRNFSFSFFERDCTFLIVRVYFSKYVTKYVRRTIQIGFLDLNLYFLFTFFFRRRASPFSQHWYMIRPRTWH